ncbi:hypothetical protein Clacol_003237 [Clathrus columnatus]|uniref:Uncharacterized protein n=1 Tax=Clathrus columnatus TaxID=1419009 RepID=A0AAV5A2X2_9AGAM|nr:hypothetical protein Clacol_003237 [Clathrus columnatus]
MSTHPKSSRDSPPKNPVPRTPRVLPAHLKYAREMKRGFGKELRAYFTPSFHNILNVNDIWRSIVSCNDPTQSFIEVERERAEIIVDIEKDGLVSFFTTNPYASKYGIDRIRHTVPARLEQVAHVLRGIARWNYFFRRRNNGTAYLQSINIGFYRIEADKRTGKTNFVGRDLNRSGRIDLPADPKELYSMHIYNDSDYELYPYLLYFDIREQSIVPYFFPPMNEETETEEPLPAHTSCTIGCTSDGMAPFVFALGDGETADIGFFKLYLTRSPIDISQILQESPFQHLKSSTSSLPRQALNSPRPRLDLDYIETNNEDWGTISVAVVQRAKGPGVEPPKINALRPSLQANMPSQFQGQTQSALRYGPPTVPTMSSSLPIIFSSAEDLTMTQPKPVVSSVLTTRRERERGKEKEKERKNSLPSSQPQRQRKDSTSNLAFLTRSRKESTFSSLRNLSTTPPPPDSFSASSPSPDEYAQSPQMSNPNSSNGNINRSSSPNPYPNPNDSMQSLHGPQGSVNSNTKFGKTSTSKIFSALRMFKKKQ